MHPAHMLFAFGGRLGRTPFIVCMLAVAGVFVAGIEASEAALPWMAQILAPRGINAGLALNVIWSLLWLLAVWSALALTVKRLRDRSQSGWWAAACILPLAALAQLNDAIFQMSRSIVLPGIVQYAVLAVSGGIALWVIYQTILPASHGHVGKTSSRRGHG